ncbi:MAG: hypothetical protein GXP25_12250 [Planctomycetes bacterium]|nr:hypothetical protein [Planctomycetota bacterium]
MGPRPLGRPGQAGTGAIEAIDKKDADFAEKLAKEHIRKFMGDVRENIRRGLYRTLAED